MIKGVHHVQKRGITGYAYKVAKGMMPKISGESESSVECLNFYPVLNDYVDMLALQRPREPP